MSVPTIIQSANDKPFRSSEVQTAEGQASTKPPNRANRHYRVIGTKKDVQPYLLDSASDLHLTQESHPPLTSRVLSSDEASPGSLDRALGRYLRPTQPSAPADPRAPLSGRLKLPQKLKLRLKQRANPTLKPKPNTNIKLKVRLRAPQNPNPNSRARPNPNYNPHLKLHVSSNSKQVLSYAEKRPVRILSIGHKQTRNSAEQAYSSVEPSKIERPHMPPSKPSVVVDVSSIRTVDGQNLSPGKSQRRLKFIPRGHKQSAPAPPQTAAQASLSSLKLFRAEANHQSLVSEVRSVPNPLFVAKVYTEGKENSSHGLAPDKPKVAGTRPRPFHALVLPSSPSSLGPTAPTSLKPSTLSVITPVMVM